MPPYAALRQLQLSSCSAEAPGTCRTARAVSNFSTERSVEQDLANLDQKQAGNNTSRTSPRSDSQDSGAIVALPPPRPSIATVCRTDVTWDKGLKWKTWCRRSVGEGSQTIHNFFFLTFRWLQNAKCNIHGAVHRQGKAHPSNIPFLSLLICTGVVVGSWNPRPKLTAQAR